MNDETLSFRKARYQIKMVKKYLPSPPEKWLFQARFPIPPGECLWNAKWWMFVKSYSIPPGECLWNANGECLFKAIQSVQVNVWIAFKWFWMSDSEITCDHPVPSQIFNQLVFRIFFTCCWYFTRGESAKQIQVLFHLSKYMWGPNYFG